MGSRSRSRMPEARIIEQLQGFAVSIDDLNHDKDNARKHSERNLQAIRDSLEQFGQRKPIVVQKQGMVVRAGNGTLMAAIDLGWSEIAAVVVDDDDVQAAAWAVADNRTGELAEWDFEALSAVTAELSEQDFDLTKLGWDERELELLLRNTEQQAPRVPGLTGDETGEPDKDTYTLRVKGISQGNKAAIEEAVRAALAEFPGDGLEVSVV